MRSQFHYCCSPNITRGRRREGGCCCHSRGAATTTGRQVPLLHIFKELPTDYLPHTICSINSSYHYFSNQEEDLFQLSVNLLFAGEPAHFKLSHGTRVSHSNPCQTWWPLRAVTALQTPLQRARSPGASSWDLTIQSSKGNWTFELIVGFFLVPERKEAGREVLAASGPFLATFRLCP